MAVKSSLSSDLIDLSKMAGFEDVQRIAVWLGNSAGTGTV